MDTPEWYTQAIEENEMDRNSPDYTPEFRAEAVKLVLNQGLSLGTAATRLSLPKATLRNWVSRAKASSTGAAPGARSVSELEAEVQRLHKELAAARLERDILKKATAYFAKEWLPGTRS